MIIVVFRSIVMYIVVLFSLRIMGKGQLGELEPFDFVVSLMIAELAAMPLEDLNSPILHGITAIITLLFLQCLTSFVSLKSLNIRKSISGKPVILYEHGKFSIREMNKLRVNVDDLIGQIRLKGYTNIKDVDYIIMETNGEVSVIANTDKQSKNCKRIPMTIVCDGKIIIKNIKKYKLSLKTLQNKISSDNMLLSDIIYGYVDENNNYILIYKNEVEV